MLTYRLHVERLAEVVLLPAHQAVSPGMEVASRSETGRVRQPWLPGGVDLGGLSSPELLNY